ncbi:MAG TPA: uracil-DNA glycosylase [Polyangiaceae bacterium]|nr:uracil-DNA glycosylase [Polyangiaceae bacterium]
MTDDAALDELRFLTRALRAHLEWQAVTGATGLERAPREVAAAPVAASTVPQPTRGAASPSPVAAPPSPVAAPPSLVAAAPVVAVPAVPAAVESASRTADEPRRLDVLAEIVRGCTRCGLCKQRKQAVFARGTGSSGVCFVGEGPGADEDAQGLPFVGKAGQLLDRMIEAMGLGRDEVYVCNIVKCRPPDNRKPEPDEMAACMPYLNEQLELIAPRVIVALGATAVQGLLGTSEGIMRMRGKWKSYRGQIDVMPTFHPAYLLRTPAAKREVWEDLQEVLRRIGRSVPPRR